MVTKKTLQLLLLLCCISVTSAFSAKSAPEGFEGERTRLAFEQSGAAASGRQASGQQREAEQAEQECCVCYSKDGEQDELKRTHKFVETFCIHIICNVCFDRIDSECDADTDPQCPVCRVGMTFGTTPLHQACANLSLVNIQQEIAAGVPVNARNKAGSTPLLVFCWYASRRGMQDAFLIEGINLLLQGGADPSLANERGMTPLIWVRPGTGARQVLMAAMHRR